VFPLRIAQVAPLCESVPPKLYGGTERVVHYLTEELMELGHDVTLFAAGDSRTRARLVPACERSLRLNPSRMDPVAYHLIMLDQLAARRNDFDVVHFHVDYLHFPLSRVLGWPQLTTLHGRLDLDHLGPVFEQFGDMPVVSISRAQRRPLLTANWLATVHHGLPEDLLRFSPRTDGYFAFLGRISPEKRVDRAIDIAVALGVPLKIAAKIDHADRAYYEREVAHLLDHPLVEYVGEIGESEKAELLGRARALLFPIDWPEPFGLVMIEAMACGTPVIAFRHGSVPEVIDHGTTGFIVDDVAQAIAAASRIDELDRRQVREVFERRFTARRMAEEYVGIYRTLAATQNDLRITA